MSRRTLLLLFAVFAPGCAKKTILVQANPQPAPAATVPQATAPPKDDRVAHEVGFTSVAAISDNISGVGTLRIGDDRYRIRGVRPGFYYPSSDSPAASLVLPNGSSVDLTITTESGRTLVLKGTCSRSDEGIYSVEWSGGSPIAIKGQGSLTFDPHKPLQVTMEGRAIEKGEVATLSFIQVKPSDPAK